MRSSEKARLSFFLAILYDNEYSFSNPQGGMFGSPDGGSTTAEINLPNTTGAAFIQPFTLDPNNGNRMIVGTDNIFYSDNVRNIDTSTWTESSATLGTMSATTISPLDGEVAYAGTSAGQTHMTSSLSTAAPGSWTRIDGGIATGSDVSRSLAAPPSIKRAGKNQIPCRAMIKKTTR